MSSWMIVVTGLLYLYISIEQGYKGNVPFCIMYGAYALANVGLYMSVTK